MPWFDVIDPSAADSFEDTIVTGFRVPYQNWDSRASLTKNMRYIEAQLEKFLHDHQPYEQTELPSV